MKIRYDLITVLGPTACGKTFFAARLAGRIDGEIISADSRQVYREMNLGTGKDYDDYIVNGEKINYHLVDIRRPGEKYNVFEYQKDFLKVYNELKNREKTPILCGGTGLYIDAVTRGYRLVPVPQDNDLRTSLENKTLDELTNILSSYKKLHNKTDIDTKKRAIRAIEIEEYYMKHHLEDLEYPQLNTFFIGLKYERDKIKERITERLQKRLGEGMIEEVDKLLKYGLKPEDLIYYGLEYKFITLYLTNHLTYSDMAGKLNIAIHQFAKRQMTWFRKMEKEGVNIHWLDCEIPVEQRIEKVIGLISE